jgi:hypothetical protein
MAKLPSSKDGIKRSNQQNKKVAHLITVDELKKRYLFGIDITDENGNELPDSAFEDYIANAVSMLEHDLDISITPVMGHVENKDYRLNDYADWGYLMLNNYPVISIEKLEMVYFRDENGEPESLQEIPHNWIRLQGHDGMLRLIPNAKFPANLQVSATGNFFPEILRATMVPDLWRITYDYGFEDGKIPHLINQIVGYFAAIQALIVAGNLVIGAGIAAETLSIDSLSQTIQTTQSAENSSYSATIKEYQLVLYGSNERNKKNSLLEIARDFYKGEQINII